MKTGEMLLTINKQDIKFLLKDMLGLEPNKLSPLCYTIDQNLVPLAPENTLREIAHNADVVACFKIIASPRFSCVVRIGGPATELSEIAVCKIHSNSSAILVSNVESFNIMYADDEDLIGFLVPTIINEIGIAAETYFPETLNIETLILLANIIDSYRYSNYRDALQHKDYSIPKLTVPEFDKLLKSSLTNPDLRWVISNIAVLAPNLLKYYKTANETSFNFLFDKGYLLSGKDTNTGDDYILLNILSIDAGAEFLNTWYKSAGIEVSFFENGVIKTIPAAFLCATVLSNHGFVFNEISEKLNYISLDNLNTKEIFNKIFSLMKSGISQQSTFQETPAKKKFCVKCGNPITPGSKFCGKCGTLTQI